MKKATTATIAEIREAKPLTVVVYSADWCVPCKAVKKQLAKLAPEFPDVTFVEVDMEERPRISRSINAMPTTKVFVRGKRRSVLSIEGAQSGLVKTMRAEIEALRA